MKIICVVIFLTSMNLYSQDKIINRNSIEIQGFKNCYGISAIRQVGLKSSIPISFTYFTEENVLKSYETYEIDVMYSLKIINISHFYLNCVAGLFVSHTTTKRSNKETSELENGIPVSISAEYYITPRFATVFSLKQLFFIKSSSYSQEILPGIGIRLRI